MLVNFCSIYVLNGCQKIPVATLFFFGHVIDLQATKIFMDAFVSNY